MSSLKVLTFNMQFGQVWDEADPDNAPVDMDRTVAQLRALDPDVILLQEVERVDTQRGQVDPPPNYSALIEALPEYDSYFSYPPQDARELPFGYGLAIFSKTDLYDTCATPLPAPDLFFTFEGKRCRPTQRVLIGARTRIDGRPVQLFNTHLQAFFIINHNSDHHRAQRKLVANLLRESTLPTLLGGDFNAAPNEGTIDDFEAAGCRSVQRTEITWRRMPYVLDHILYNNQLRPLGHEIVNTDASDHKIVMARFEFTVSPPHHHDTRSPFAAAGGQ